MDIEEFYDADPRRRASDELEYGREWRDAAGRRFGLSYVADTGEVYVMREPEEPIDVIPAFGTEIVEPLDEDTLTVEILGTVTSRDDLERRLDGWADAMAGEGDTLAWARARLAG